jgi:hypothetical protein
MVLPCPFARKASEAEVSSMVATEGMAGTSTSSAAASEHRKGIQCQLVGVIG